jgi:ADP-heptose:LPS heptosyltransferase
MSPSRVGVLVGRDLIGDALIKLPFVRALRAAFPAAEIHWITTQGPTAYNGALKEITSALIDRLFEADQGKDASSRSPPIPVPRSLPYPLLLDTRGKWRGALAARAWAKGGVFIAPAWRYLLSDRRPRLFAPKPKRMIDRLFQMLDLATGEPVRATGRLAVPPAFAAKAALALPEGPTYVGLAPGAGNPIKIWPQDRFAALAAYLSAKGLTPVFLLGPDEKDRQPFFQTACPQALFPLQDRALWGTSSIALEETLALGTRLTLAVTNDSGTSHMLAAVDCPLLSLFGPTSATKLAPYVRFGRVLTAQSFGGSAMDLIPLQMVESEVDQAIFLLNQPRNN